MKRTFGSLLAVCLLVSATAAFGGVKAGSFSVTPLIGGYVYDDDQHTDSSLVLGGRAGYNITKAIGVEALYDYVTRSNASAGPFSKVVVNRYGGQVLYHFFPDSIFVPYLAAGYSGINFDSPKNDKTYGTFDYGVGAKFFVTDNFAVRGDVRHLLYKFDSRTNNNLEYTLGAYFQFGGSEPVAKEVVPEAVPVAEPAPVVESEPVKVEVVPAPVTAPPADSDNDGVVDPLDSCSNTPAGVTVGSDGCPLDTDKDGVSDYLDKCPATPVGAVVDANGCSVEVAKRFCDKPAVIDIKFDHDKADIKIKYCEDLNNVGNFLKDFPRSKGTIDGHADSDGSKAYNVKLSKRRAENVRSYIINKFGIDGDRISTNGYGETKPVASNKTAAGKAKNRRIEAVFSCE